jgi:hypothetical protein
MTFRRIMYARRQALKERDRKLREQQERDDRPKQKPVAKKGEDDGRQ